MSSTEIYKIKSEAVQFFSEKYADKFYTLNKWNDIGIHINALEKVKKAYIMRWLKESDTVTSLSSWDNEKGGQFQFTIYFPYQSYAECEWLRDPVNTRKLLDKIQVLLDEEMEKAE